MADIEFRTGVRDKLGYTARWLAQAHRRGVRVRVVGDEQDLRTLSQQLWMNEQEGFIPHSLTPPWAEIGPGMGLTPLWLGPGPVPGEPPTLLVNLGHAAPAAIEGYSRVIEIVSSQPEDEQAGRARWVAYKKQGHEPWHRKPHDDASDEV